MSVFQSISLYHVLSKAHQRLVSQSGLIFCQRNTSHNIYPGIFQYLMLMKYIFTTVWRILNQL